VDHGKADEGNDGSSLNWKREVAAAHLILSADAKECCGLVVDDVTDW
jgi:hypothetical protein